MYHVALRCGQKGNVCFLWNWSRCDDLGDAKQQVIVGILELNVDSVALENMRPINIKTALSIYICV